MTKTLPAARRTASAAACETSSVRWRCEQAADRLARRDAALRRGPCSPSRGRTSARRGACRRPWRSRRTRAARAAGRGCSTRPALRSRLSCARRVRISFARSSASIRWTSERSGAATEGLAGVFVGGRHGGESTSERRAGNPNSTNSARPQLEVRASWRRVDGVSVDLQGFSGVMCYGLAVGALRRPRDPAVCQDFRELRGDPGAGQRIAEATPCRRRPRSAPACEQVAGVTSVLDAAHPDDRDLDPRADLRDLRERDRAGPPGRTRRRCRRRARARRDGADGRPCRAAC